MLEYFLDPHPDEILYSVWARYSDQVHYPSLSDVLQELFGKEHISAIVDLPGYLGYFFDHLPIDHEYTIDTFIDDHTLFPFYASFMTSEQRDTMRTQMIAGNRLAIYALVKGAGRSSIPRPSWLRYCPLCLQDDRSQFGECYWHRLHQVPGVEVCPVHMTFLENSSFPVGGFFRKDKRFIAAEKIVQPMLPRKATNSPYFQTLLDIAHDAEFLLKSPHISLERDMLRDRYTYLLSSQKFLTKAGLVRKLNLLEAFVSHYSSELLTLLHCEVGMARTAERNWPAEMVKPTSGKNRRHPLEHILVIRFLDSTVENFFLQPPSKVLEHASPFGSGPWPCLNPACEYYRQPHILTYQLTRDIVTYSPAHARTLKYSHPVGLFSCSCGFVYSRKGPDQSPSDVFKRDRIISHGSVWEAKLRDLWLNPQLRLRSIADQLGTNEEHLYRQAARLQLPIPRISNYNMKNYEKQTYKAKKDPLAYRERWLTLIKENPEKGRKALYKLAPQDYSWLREYDKEWFFEHCPARRFPQKSHVHELLSPDKQRDSNENDIYNDSLTADAIRNACKLLVSQEPPKRITLGNIFLYVPQADILRQKPDKAPLTTQTLDEVLETPEDFTIRRIKWTTRQYQKEGYYPTRGTFIHSIRIDNYVHLPKVQKALDEAMDSLSV